MRMIDVNSSAVISIRWIQFHQRIDGVGVLSVRRMSFTEHLPTWRWQNIINNIKDCNIITQQKSIHWQINKPFDNSQMSILQNI